jgi:hypothetical protein
LALNLIISEKWKTRIKGRDWYDLVWYIRNNYSLDLAHLEERMKQSGHFSRKEAQDKKKFLEIFFRQVDSMDFEKAKLDVLPFLKDPDSVSIWGKRFFKEIVKSLRYN